MTAAGIAVLLLTIATAAAAEGSWLEPSTIRVEEGDTITLTGEVSSGQLGWVQQEPYFAYLSGATYGDTVAEGTGGFETEVPLGRLEIEASASTARVTVEFELPRSVPPGEYWVTVCNRPCTTGLGDLIGSILYVGVDPPGTGHSAAEEFGAATLAIAEATDDAIERPSAGLALARHPARRTGLDAAWVAMSAGFGLLVLLLASVVRTKNG